MGVKMITRKTLVPLFLLCFAVALPVHKLHAQNTTAVSLDALIQEAMDNNPEIQQAFHYWKAAEYRTSQEKGLPDPRLSYGYFGENVETRVGPQEQKIGVSQKIPFPGKLREKGKIQAKEAGIRKEKYEALKNEVIKDVKIAFYDLYWLDQTLSIIDEEKSILEEIESVAQRKYGANLSSHQSVIKLQVELSKIIERFALTKQNRKSTVARMNRYLGWHMQKPFDTIRSIERKSLLLGLEEVLEKAKETRQELIAADLAVERAELERALAGRDYLPDLTFGVEYISIGGGTTSSADDGKDAWVGMVSVNVPIWFGKIKSGIKAKEEELKAARMKQEDVEDLVVYEVQDLYFRIEAYKDIVSLYETALVPQAQQAFDASRTGFETGSVSFIDWLDTQRTYLQTRLAYYKAVVDYQKAIAFLERVVGEQIGGLHEE